MQVVWKIKRFKNKKLKKLLNIILKVIIDKNKKQACSIFGSCIIKNIKNQESPKWLKIEF